VNAGRSLVALALLGWVAGSACATPPPPAWQDSFLARVEALALLQTLNADLLSHDSATLTLEHWCGSHHLANPAQVSAQRVSGIDKPVDDEQRRLLRVGASDVVRYRRVQLTCGGVMLSQADNWYVPGRLTPDMNVQLDASDTPFGKVVGPLHFQRHTISAMLLWQPLPPGWETDSSAAPAVKAGASLTVPAAVLEHRAVLTLPDGTPFSAVVETYTGNVLAFPMPVAGHNLSKR
jgi:chorismate-pyruvate lyase